MDYGELKMNYGLQEQTVCPELKRNETSIKEQMEMIIKKLNETKITLENIISNIDGRNIDEKVNEQEPRCMNDQVINIHRLADNCMEISQRIIKVMF